MCPVLVCVYSVRPRSSYFSPSHITTRSLGRQPVVSALCTIWLGWACASEGQRRYGGGSYFIPTYISHHLLDVERRAARALLAIVALARAPTHPPRALACSHPLALECCFTIPHSVCSLSVGLPIVARLCDLARCVLPLSCLAVPFPLRLFTRGRFVISLRHLQASSRPTARGRAPSSTTSRSQYE